MTDIPENWHESLVLVWSEDDASRAARDVTRERLGQSVWSGDVGLAAGSRQGAWARLTGSELNTSQRLAAHDAGDAAFYLHPGGWVECRAYNGDHIYTTQRTDP